MVVKSESANPELDRIRASSLVGDPAEGEAGRPNIRGNQARLAADPNQRHETVLSNVMILPDELDPKGDAADDATSISAEGDGAVSRSDHLEGAAPATIVPASSRAEGGRVPSGATNPESAGQAAVAAADPIGIQALEPGTVGDARRLGSGAAAPEVDAPDMGFAIGPIAPSSGSMSRSGVQPDNVSALPVDEASSSSAQLAVQPPSGTHTPEAEPVTLSLTITSAGAVFVAENLAGTVYSVIATSPDASTALTYSLSGTDAVLFDIDANTGAVSFKAAPDAEDARDAGGDNVYDVKVIASDGTNTTTKDVAITVTDVNEGPTFTSATAVSAVENATGAVYTAAATNPDAGATLTYALSGTDTALFEIDASTGAVSFKASADFEDARDAGGDNIYDVKVTVSDGANTATQDVAITVTNDNEGPTITSGAAASVAENSSGTVYTATAIDPDAGTTLTYALSGVDASLFDIDANTGAVSFKSSPDAEDARDAGGDNVYDVKVIASDGTNTTTQDVVITVTNQNEGPTFTSATAVSAVENATGTVYMAAATDPDAGATLTYALSGTDAALFDIDANTGAISFKAPADFEDARDAGGNNVYDVKVTVSDGANTATQDVAITVTNQNEGPTITSGAAASVAENSSGTVYTAAATDPDAGTTLTYALSGADAALFDIDAQTGAVSFKSSPDAEDARDAGGDNVYDVKVIASDGTNTATKDVAISVTGVNETGPSLSFNGGAIVNVISVSDFEHGVAPTAAVSAGLTLDGWSIKVGTTFQVLGESQVRIGSNGAYGNSVDIAYDGMDQTIQRDFSGLEPNATYVFTLRASSGGSDGTAKYDDNGIAVTINGVTSTIPPASLIRGFQTFTIEFQTDANGKAHIEVAGTDPTSDGEGAVIDTFKILKGTASDFSPVLEGAATGTVVGTAVAVDLDVNDSFTYALTDDAGGRFAIDPATGVITVADGSKLDFETSAFHDIKVRVTDSGGLSSESTVTVAIADQLPVFVGSHVLSVAENTTGAFFTPSVSDGAGSSVQLYSLSGADAALFNIDAATGAIRFKSTPNFEMTTDVGRDHVYDVTLSARNATGVTTQDFQITLTNVVEANEVASRYGGDGDDVLIGDAGKSDLFGGAGNDILIGLAGADLLSGGTGNDTASYAGSNAAVNVLLGGTSTGGHAAGDTFQSIENLIGSSFGDVLKGDGGDNIIEGGGGGDAISGGPGSDTASYAGAATGVFADLSRRQLKTGDAAGDVYSSVENVLGSAFDDTLGGNALDNVLTGGAGNDQLMGYAGNDTLYGDAGADLFIMNVGAGVDTVFGGAGGGWIDVIELRDSVNVTYNGGFPGDWTMVLTSGQVIGTEAEAFNLSADAAGYLENTDGTRVNFSEIEQIRW
jgi:VCBS repeat-containing protein